MTSLKNFYRQPEIYIRLPNGGRFYPEGTIDIPSSGDIPVFALTAKDDISIKTPDALMSGTAVVECIKSCIPSIKDPWEMPANDKDYLLIAIRIASYGTNLELETQCPVKECQHEFNVDVNLTRYMDIYQTTEMDPTFPVIKHEIENDYCNIYIKPMSYKDYIVIQQKSYETQRAIRMAEFQKELPEKERNEIYMSILETMHGLTLESIHNGVEKIVLSDNTIIDDKEQITEFIDNTSVTLVNSISDKLEQIRKESDLEPLDIVCPKCEHNYKSPIIMDYSVFFC